MRKSGARGARVVIEDWWTGGQGGARGHWADASVARDAGPPRSDLERRVRLDRVSTESVEVVGMGVCTLGRKPGAFCLCHLSQGSSMPKGGDRLCTEALPWLGLA